MTRAEEWDEEAIAAMTGALPSYTDLAYWEDRLFHHPEDRRELAQVLLVGLVSAGWAPANLEAVTKRLHKWGRGPGCDGRNVTQEVCTGCIVAVRSLLGLPEEAKT